MNQTLFVHLSSHDIARMVDQAYESICYAAPGISKDIATAMVKKINILGPEMITVSIDFNERVMRMGYGDIDAVRMLRGAGIIINNSAKLRSALIVVDNEGYTFTPTALYLEAESESDSARNALRLSPEQVSEALARLSPAAKAIAIAKTTDSAEKSRIANLPVEVGSTQVNDAQFRQVDATLKEAPPVPFDLARQVRVFDSYIQYVELSLTGAAIQRHRLAIPASIQKLGGAKDMEGRLKTTFDLIKKGGKLSSKPLDDALNEIRKNFTPSLGKDHGRVVLKSAKPFLLERLEEFRKKLEAHQQQVGAELQKHLDESRQAIIDYYLDRVIDAPPDELLGQLLSGEVNESVACEWLN
ncbi:MAG: hypothetical protein HQL48_11875, partial [Gammaproteobacteria bacterium]|nr:hypothetical protein [Gammaproteobacteria bacterium]